MSTASQNYIIPEINSNKYINNNVYLYNNTNANSDLANSETFHYYCYNSEINNDWKNRVFTSVFNYLSI